MKYATLELGTIEAVFNKLGGIEGAQAFLRNEVTMSKPPKPNLLELVTTIPVAACERFVAKERFKVDTSRKAEVKIAWLGDNLKKHFLSKIEEGMLAGELKVNKLLKSSLDAPIMTELGESKAYSTTLADLWAMLERQPDGEKGELLVNGYANIFYIHDTKGNLWAVGAGWHQGDGGWNVEAGSVGGPSGWRGGRQVVSR